MAEKNIQELPEPRHFNFPKMVARNSRVHCIAGCFRITCFVEHLLSCDANSGRGSEHIPDED